MTEAQDSQIREQAVRTFDLCACCGRKVYEIAPRLGTPRRFTYEVVTWNQDPKDLRFVCNMCLQLYNTPHHPFRFYN